MLFFPIYLNYNFKVLKQSNHCVLSTEYIIPFISHFWPYSIFLQLPITSQAFPLPYICDEMLLYICRLLIQGFEAIPPLCIIYWIYYSIYFALLTLFCISTASHYFSSFLLVLYTLSYNFIYIYAKKLKFRDSVHAVYYLLNIPLSLFRIFTYSSFSPSFNFFYLALATS